MITFKEFKKFIDENYPQWSTYVYEDSAIHIGVNNTYCFNVDKYTMSICDTHYPHNTAQHYNLLSHIEDDTIWQFIDEKLRENQEAIQAFIDKINNNYIPDRCERVVSNCGFYIHKFNNRMKVYRYKIDSTEISITPPHDFVSDFVVNILNLNNIADMTEVRFETLEACLEYITK